MLIILISCARGLLLVCILVDLSSVESLNYVSVKALKQNYQIFCVPTRILKASSKATRLLYFWFISLLFSILHLWQCLQNTVQFKIDSGEI